MTLEIVARLGACAGALLLLKRTNGTKGLLGAGFFVGIATLGFQPTPYPTPLAIAAFVLLLTSFCGLAFWSTWSPLVSKAAVSGAFFTLPLLFLAAVALRHSRPVLLFAALGSLAAALSFFFAEASRANSEAGWRRGVTWGCALLLPPALAAGLSVLPETTLRPLWLSGFFGFLVAALVWLPAGLAEWKRVGRELGEEVRLGLIPAEDARVLSVPWRRRFEPRFGRLDERREYVRSALLLAVARQQQRRRTGEAVRLRQLEVLAFRTRIRRTLDARTTRSQRSSSDEFPPPDIAQGD